MNKIGDIVFYKDLPRSYGRKEFFKGEIIGEKDDKFYINKSYKHKDDCNVRLIDKSKIILKEDIIENHKETSAENLLEYRTNILNYQKEIDEYTDVNNNDLKTSLNELEKEINEDIKKLSNMGVYTKEFNKQLKIIKKKQNYLINKQDSKILNLRWSIGYNRSLITKEEKNLIKLLKELDKM